MSRYGNLAAGPDNRVTPEDMACWRDLIAGAKVVAGGDVEAAITRFKTVARAAGNACAPGAVTRDNAFVKLSRLSRYILRRIQLVPSPQPQGHRSVGEQEYERLAEIAGALVAERLQDEIDFAVIADFFNIAGNLIGIAEILKNFILIENPEMLTIDYGFKTEVGFADD